ncbi:MAG: DUF2207 domain-containing protein [Desulfuromonadales bacterium]|nr:DUF2207 domain-containing protein [Desulfuromonadales bacterium]
MRSLLLILLALFSATSLWAGERILAYHSDIEVYADGSMQVTETITVKAERKRIKRGIYRDFPTSYKDRFGNQYRVGFSVLSARRDGVAEAWHSKPIDNGVRVYLGKKDVILTPDEYRYELTYRTDRQLGFFDEHDELYWNVTGNHWEFPIDHVTASVTLPSGIDPSQLGAEAYTGAYGASGSDYSAEITYDGEVDFAATRRFRAGEGLTLVVTWPKGYVTPPSLRENVNFLLRDNLSWVIVVAGFMLLLGYYLLAWIMVGRDPEAGVVITRYLPPSGLAPGPARLISRMGYDHKVFTAALVNLAVKGLIEISEEGKAFTLKRTTLQAQDLGPGERVILKRLFRNQKGVSFTIEQSKHATLAKALNAHEEALLASNERVYFVRNRNWLIPGILFSVLFFGGVIYGLGDLDQQGTAAFLSFWLACWTLGVVSLFKKTIRAWKSIDEPVEIIGALFITAFTAPFVVAEVVVLQQLAIKTSSTVPAALLGAIALTYLFHHLLKAPTRSGRRLLDQIEGFRQFLDVAERDEMNFRNPPEKTPQLFERYLPYALALDVEQRWIERFASTFATLNEQNQAYQPHWYCGRRWRQGSLGDFGSSIGSSLSSALATNSTAPGSSSGSGGGGFSGGGGGGGGGGGW